MVKIDYFLGGFIHNCIITLFVDFAKGKQILGADLTFAQNLVVG